MVIREQPASKPEQPPQMKRRFELYPTQLIGVPLLMMIPVLALFDVFGDDRARPKAAMNQVELSVDYPSKTRYRIENRMTIRVHNGSSTPIKPKVALTSEYLDAFSEVRMEPQPKSLTSGKVEVEMEEVPPGQTGEVKADFRAERYGKHRGRVWVDGGPSVELSTTILP